MDVISLLSAPEVSVDTIFTLESLEPLTVRVKRVFDGKTMAEDTFVLMSPDDTVTVQQRVKAQLPPGEVLGCSGNPPPVSDLKSRAGELEMSSVRAAVEGRR